MGLEKLKMEFKSLSRKVPQMVKTREGRGIDSMHESYESRRSSATSGINLGL